MRASRWLMLTPLLLFGLPVPARADGLDDLARAYAAAHTSVSAATVNGDVPSFARQTGLACSACHYQFLTLTPFGRKFKLNGYTMTALIPITEKDTTNGGKLNLSPTALVSAMLTTSFTHLKDTISGQQNDVTHLPDQFSVFVAGQITSKVGMFSQFTYAGPDGSFGIDNIDLRYANHTQIGGKTDMVYGLTLHNNPTVQDLWNTTPAWGFPFIGSPVAPGGSASAVIDGALSQNVLGLGGYAMIGNTVYGEFSAYRSAQQGSVAPTADAIHGIAPYWRVALQKEWEKQYLMIGTYGMYVSYVPGGVTGTRNSLTDAAVDAQFETKAGSGNFVARGTYLHENQKLDASWADGASANQTNSLNTFRLNGSYYPKQWVGLSAGYFQTTGSVDAVLYAPNPVDGSANGDPKTSGFVGELDFNPWENTRLGVQYTGYSKFNGGSTNYDGSGRNASGNNNLLLFAWIAF